MIKEINGYKVRISQKEGMKYVKVVKENRLSQEFIGKEISESEIEGIARRMIKGLENVNTVSDNEIKESKKAERGFFQVLAEDRGITFDKAKFKEYAKKQKAPMV